MTLTLDRPSTVPTWTIGAPRLLAALDVGYDEHIAAHGPMPHLDRDRLVALLDDVALGGRGGAGFPFADKVRAMPNRGGTIVVNGSESEPASRKDRVLLGRAPHLVIDGALAVAAALRADDVTIAIHDAAVAYAAHSAIPQRGDARQVRVVRTSGGFVSGEARALVRGLGGGPAVPPGRRVHLTRGGTLVANAETFAQTAVAIRLGPHAFRATGTHAEPGTALLTVGGAVARPGVVEIPLGTPLGIVLTAAGVAEPRAVITGGYHGTWHPGWPQVRLSRGAMSAAGLTLGAGVLLVLDGSTCALGELFRVTTWLAAQSAGQCGPCRFGLPALARDVAAIVNGAPDAPAAAQRHARMIDGRGACRHPDGTTRFVASALGSLGEEIAMHRAHGTCGRPVRGLLPVTS